MAVVREFTTKSGVRIIIRDDLMAADQEKAWKEARATASAIFYANQRRAKQ